MEVEEGPCEHYNYGWIKLYRRPWRRFFRKQVFWVCCACGDPICMLEGDFH